MSADFYAHDPAQDPARDAVPASTPTVRFTSGGETLPGVLHLPAGPGPHPIAVLLHGFPGNERNFDLAQALRRAGYAAIVFHYRGSWGTGGSWSWRNVLEDAASVAAAVRDEAFTAAHRLDPHRTSLIGHSVGGFAALMTAAADPAVGIVVSIAGADLGLAAEATTGNPALHDGLARAWDEELLPLRGTSGAALVDELEAAGPAWRLSRLAPQLADRSVLLVGTGRDPATPAAVHHRPLVEAFQAHPLPHLEHQEFFTDHALSDHRVTLARTVVDFVDRHRRRKA